MIDSWSMNEWITSLVCLTNICNLWPVSSILRVGPYLPSFMWACGKFWSYGIVYGSYNIGWYGWGGCLPQKYL